MTALIVLLGAVMLQSGAPMRTVDRGDQSNIDAQKQIVARTPAEWTTLWRQHAPDRPQPQVDLSKDMIVAVFLGSRNTAGYSVEIVSAQPGADALIVRYRQREPGRDAITAQIITMPYHIVAVPRTTGEVKFERVQ